MNSLPITCKDAKTTFLLARRAERLARPLVERLDGGLLHVEVTLDGGHYYRHSSGWHIGLSVHRVTRLGTLGNMALQALVITNSGELDQAIDRLRFAAESDERIRLMAERAVGGEDADA